MEARLSKGVFRWLMSAAAMGTAVVSGWSAASAQTIPIAVVSRTKLLTTINGNAGHVAANSAGDGFYVSQTDNTAYWLPRGATKPVALVTGLSGGRSIYVDQNNNVYVPSNYSGATIEIPYVNGGYASGIALSSVTGSACSSATPSAPCAQFGSGGSVTSYYYQPTDLGFDASGNAYMIDEYSNNGPGGPGKSNSILKWTLTKGAYTPSYIATGLPQNNNAQIAVDGKGNVYYADGTNLYSVPSGASAATIITSSAMTNPTGVATDMYGNVYVTNASVPYAILELPAVNGVAVPSKQFVFSQGYSANGIAFDGLGDYFYTGYSSSTNFNEATLYSFNLGSSALGTAVSSTATSLSLLFTGAATPASITLQGASAGFSYAAGTCAAGTAYGAGSSCTINVNYTPTAAGLQRGAVVFANASGAPIANVMLSGQGLGAAQTSDPGTLTAIGSGWKTPQGVAVDAANNVYIADPGQNVVLRYAAGASTSTSVGTGLVAPTGVALDGAGNLFIADSGNGRVVEVPNIAGTLTSSAQTVVTSGLGTSLGIAVDQNANLYIADANNNKVLMLADIDGTPNAAATSTVKAGTTVAPLALATDPTGNLFVGDVTGNTIAEVLYYGKSVLTIGSGYSHPSGLATDGAGSLYVADAGNNRLLKIPYEKPIFNTNDQYLVGSTIAAPYGVALDAASNLYVVDSANAAAYMLNRTQGTLALGRANLNNPTSTLNAYEGNSGNLPLILGTPAYAAAGSTAVFTVNSPASNGCVNGGTIAAGFSCVLNASFNPTVVGNFSDTLTFTSNAVNTSSPSITLTGVGLNLAATTLSLAQTSPTGTASFGQTVTVTATISSTKSGTPTGTITIYVDGGQPITVTVNGATVAVPLKGLTGGKHTIAASYTGDNNFAPSNTTLSITIGQATSTTSVSAPGTLNLPSVAQNPTSTQAGVAIVFQAIITPAATTLPTGTVTFTSGSTVLGTASVAPTGTSGTIYAATSSGVLLPAGTNTVVATYSGDVNYAGSSGNVQVIISPETYTLTQPPGTVTMGPASTATVSFQVSSISGYGGYVGLVCTGLPANTICGFSPNGFVLQASNQITAATKDINGNTIIPATYGPTPVTLTIETGTTPVVPQPPVGALRPLSGWGRAGTVAFALLGILPLSAFLRGRRRVRGALRLLSVFLLLAGGALFFSGCGNSLVGVTPKGNYTVTVTATSVASGYTGALAPGCATSASASTAATPTCTQTATFTLTIQ